MCWRVPALPLTGASRFSIAAAPRKPCLFEGDDFRLLLVPASLHCPARQRPASRLSSTTPPPQCVRVRVRARARVRSCACACVRASARARGPVSRPLFAGLARSWRRRGDGERERYQVTKREGSGILGSSFAGLARSRRRRDQGRAKPPSESPAAIRVASRHPIR